MAAPFSYFLCGLFFLSTLFIWKRTRYKQLFIYNHKIASAPTTIVPITNNEGVTSNTHHIGDEEFLRRSFIRRLSLKLALAFVGWRIDYKTPLLFPATAIGWTKNCFTWSDYDTIAADLAARDDVWNRNFLTGEAISSRAMAILASRR